MSRILGIDNKGFSTSEMIISSAIIAMSGLAISGFGQTANQYSRKIAMKAGISDVRSEIILASMSPKAWGLTVSNAGTIPAGKDVAMNPELTCLKVGSTTPCDEGSYPLSLLDSAGNILVDAQDPTQGFTMHGKQCNSFNINSTQSDECVFRYELSWQAVCPPALTSCLNPQVRLQANLLAKTQMLNLMNVQSRSLAVDLYIGKAEAIAAPPPVVLPQFFTNSTLYSANNTINIDLSTLAPGMTTSLPAALSTQGGTLSLAGSILTYTPPAGFYGHDSLSYIATDAGGNSNLLNIKVEVMTPHTWTGQDGTADTSSATNWCGEVVAGVCSHANFGATGLLGAQAHVVFDDTCSSNCSADFNQATLQVAKFESKPAYSGTININGSNLLVNTSSAGAYALGNRTNTSADCAPDLNIQGGFFNFATAGGNLSVYGSVYVGNAVSSVSLPSLNIYTHKNVLGVAVCPTASAGLQVDATAPQIPTWNTAGHPVSITPVENGMPQIKLDPSLNLNQLTIPKCKNSFGCQAYFLSPTTTSPVANITNTNVSSGVFADKCKNFFLESSSLALDATAIVNVSGNSSDQYVDKVKTANISGNSGDIFVLSALHVTNIQGNSGDVVAHVGILDNYQGNSGDSCVKATSIGHYKGSSGDAYIAAYHIAELEGNSGDYFVNGAQIDKVTGSSGDICLYNGATVGDVSGFSGKINPASCPAGLF